MGKAFPVCCYRTNDIFEYGSAVSVEIPAIPKIFVIFGQMIDQRKRYQEQKRDKNNKFPDAGSGILHGRDIVIGAMDKGRNDHGQNIKSSGS